MIFRCLLTAFFCLATLSTFAQVRVELFFDQETYLPLEPLYVEVRVYNTSGQTLELGTDNEWLKFNIEATDNAVVRMRQSVQVEQPFSLPNGSRVKKFVKLNEAYELNRFGRYLVTATVRIKEWDQLFSTERTAHFGVSKGVTLWETAFGIPAEKPVSRPEIRKFQLVQSIHQKELTLYGRVTSEDGLDTFSLTKFGILISFSKPEPQLDRWSNLHVLYQDGAKSFRYNMMTPDGLILSRQKWEIDDHDRPKLVVNAEGRIEVKGGVRRVSGEDLPPPDLLSDAPAEAGRALADKSPDAVQKKK